MRVTEKKNRIRIWIENRNKLKNFEFFLLLIIKSFFSKQNYDFGKELLFINCYLVLIKKLIITYNILIKICFQI